MGKFYYLFSSSLFKVYFIKNGYLLAHHFFNEMYIFMIAFYKNAKEGYLLVFNPFLLLSTNSLSPVYITFLKSMSLFLVSYLLNMRLRKHKFSSIFNTSLAILIIFFTILIIYTPYITNYPFIYQIGLIASVCHFSLLVYYFKNTIKQNPILLLLHTLSITPILIFYITNIILIDTGPSNINFSQSQLSITVLLTIIITATSSIIAQNWIYTKTKNTLLKPLNLTSRTNVNNSNKDKSLNIDNQLQIQRERLARDLHDGIGSQLTHIITKLDILAIKSEDSRQLELLSDFARETNQILRETVWVLNQNNIEYSLLQKRISSFLNKLWQEREHPELQIAMSTKSSLLISPIIAMNVFRICQEVINNALKYANASCIEITFYQKPHKVLIEIKDNGRGFELTKMQKGYGLDNIRKRCSELGGQLFLVSNSAGTAILCELPPVELGTYLSGNKID